MVCVRGSTLAQFDTVLICRAGGKPSTWFPPGTRKADPQILNMFTNFPSQVILKSLFPAPEFVSENFHDKSKNIIFSTFW